MNDKENKIEAPTQQVAQEEQELAKLQAELAKLVKNAAGNEVGLHLIESNINRILEIIPDVRKKTAIIKFEKAVNVYRQQLLESEIEEGIIEHIESKRREELSARFYILDHKHILAIEKNIGISTVPGGTMPSFDSLRMLLGKTGKLDEIEAIVSKIKQAWEAKYALEDLHVEKKTLVDRFVKDAGFDNRAAVKDMLLNKTAKELAAKNPVNEQKLKESLRSIKDEYVKLSKYIVSAMNNKVKIVNDVIKQQLDIINKSMLEEAPFFIQCVSRCFIEPVSLFLSLAGISIIVLYAASRYLSEAMGEYFPLFAGFLDSAGVNQFAASMNPGIVIGAGAAIFLIGGILRLIDDKIKRAAINKKIIEQKGSYIY